MVTVRPPTGGADGFAGVERGRVELIVLADELPDGHLGRCVAPRGQQIADVGAGGSVDHVEGGEDHPVLGRADDAALVVSVERGRSGEPDDR